MVTVSHVELPDCEISFAGWQAYTEGNLWPHANLSKCIQFELPNNFLLTDSCNKLKHKTCLKSSDADTLETGTRDLYTRCSVAYPGILFGEGQQIQLRTKDREKGDLGAVAPLVRGSGGS